MSTSDHRACRPIDVLKLGGSLFEIPNLRDEVRRRVDPAAVTVLVPGGGRFADAVRSYGVFLRDGVTNANATEIEHEAAVAACNVSAVWAAGLLGWPQVSQLSEVGKQAECRVASAALGEDNRFPRDWSVTSDTLAAVIAERLSARRLVLLKSVGPFPSLVTAADAGAVDRAVAATRWPFAVEWDTLRDK